MSLDSPQKFQQLSAQVPDYYGYDDYDKRKSSDKALRMFLIDTIKHMQNQLIWDFSAQESKDQRRLEELVKSTRRKLQTISLSLKSPTYQDVSFFSAQHLSARRIQRIYDLEIQMMLEIDHIVEELAFVTSPDLKTDIFKEHFLRIQNFIDNVNQFLFEREALIVGEE